MATLSTDKTMNQTTTAQRTIPMMRRGRPRKSGPREVDGRAKRAGPDRGTKEVQDLRQWYAGEGDPVLTAYPLGILLANGAITEEQHSAACDYAWLVSRVFGRHSLAAVSWEMMDRGRDSDLPTPEDEEREEKQQRRLTRIREAFAKLPRRCRAGLDNLAIYERIPRWMRPVDPRDSDVTEARLFTKALAVLVRLGS